MNIKDETTEESPEMSAILLEILRCALNDGSDELLLFSDQLIPQLPSIPKGMP